MTKPPAPERPYHHGDLRRVIVQAALDILSRDIRRYTAEMFKPDMPTAEADLLASLIEEEDWTASLGETLYQVARRIERQKFTKAGREMVDATLDQVAEAMRAITPATQDMPAVSAEAAPRLPALLDLRARCIRQPDLSWAERGAILTILGSAERAYFLIERIDDERRSVTRSVPAASAAERSRDADVLGAVPVPA